MYYYLIAMLAVPLLMLGWIAVQSLARRYAYRHPEFGPFREEGGGCGTGCACSGSERCRRQERKAE